MDNMNVLLLGTTTGESPNNSIVAELLSREKVSNICNVTIGQPGWESLYFKHHQALMNLYSNYIYRTLHLENFLNLEAMITLALDDNDYSIDNFGFKFKGLYECLNSCTLEKIRKNLLKKCLTTYLHIMMYLIEH